MKMFLTLMMALLISVIAGCAPVSPPSDDSDVAMNDEYSDEEVIVESDDGMDADERILREGDGRYMNLVETYTMPADEADISATPDQVLLDANGKEYKIVDHIGPDSE